MRNFDVILLTTMNIIYKIHGGLKESPFGDASRQQVRIDSSQQFSSVRADELLVSQKMNELRQKARSLMMFAGMVSSSDSQNR